MRRPRGISNIGSLSNARQPEVNFLSLDFEQTFGQIVSLRVKTISHTNMVASRYIKKGKSSLPVDVRRSKTLLLKLPNKYPCKLVIPSCWVKTFLNYLQLLET